MQRSSLKIKIMRVIQYLPNYTIHGENSELQLSPHYLACYLSHTSLITIPDGYMECWLHGWLMKSSNLQLVPLQKVSTMWASYTETVSLSYNANHWPVQPEKGPDL